MIDEQFEYDVALSFAGEDRTYVENVATILSSEGIRVFYDRFDETNLWGKDLYAHLDEVYRKKAKFCVMFISRAYADKAWPNHERKSAQARAFQKHEEYILPARFDDTEIPGVLPTIAYIDLSSLLPQELAERIVSKVRSSPIKVVSSANTFRKPKLKNTDFNPYEEALRFIEYLIQELTSRSKLLHADGISSSIFNKGDRRCFRIVRGGTAVYSLDVWMGGFAGESSLTFYGVSGSPMMSEGSSNAWANVIWPSGADHPSLEFHDISLLGDMRERKIDPMELIDRIWDAICDALERNG